MAVNEVCKNRPVIKVIHPKYYKQSKEAADPHTELDNLISTELDNCLISTELDSEISTQLDNCQISTQLDKINFT